MRVKDFQGNLDEWFDYVEQNRRSGHDHYKDYDILWSDRSLMTRFKLLLLFTKMESLISC